MQIHGDEQIASLCLTQDISLKSHILQESRSSAKEQKHAVHDKKSGWLDAKHFNTVYCKRSWFQIDKNVNNGSDKVLINFYLHAICKSQSPPPRGLLE